MDSTSKSLVCTVLSSSLFALLPLALLCSPCPVFLPPMSFLYHLSFSNHLLPLRLSLAGTLPSSLICLLLVPAGSIYLRFCLSLTFLLHLVPWPILSPLLAIYLLLTLTASSYTCRCLPSIRSHFISQLLSLSRTVCFLLTPASLSPSFRFSSLILSLLVFSSVYLSSTRTVSLLYVPARSSSPRAIVS